MAARYDRIAARFDFFKGGDSRRWAAGQKKFFAGLRGKILCVGIGTGLEIANLPPDLDVAAIDLSRGMLQYARPRAAAYRGKFRLINMDAELLGFKDESFDAIVTVCVFCTVPDPVRGLRELRRVLKPGGKVFMFEHVMSRNLLYGLTLQFMGFFTRILGGTYLDRDTVSNLRQAGFDVEAEHNAYLDIVKAIVGCKK